MSVHVESWLENNLPGGMDMINIGILGFGVVGSGVAEVIAMNLEKLEKHLEQPIRVKRI